MKIERKVLAVRFLKGVYGGDPSVVDQLASEEIVSTYPIFKRLFQTSALHGRKAMKDFAIGFSKRWAETSITIHEAIVEGNKVVLVWSFRARNVGVGLTGEPPSGEVHSWGGITFFRFDDSDKIILEMGEESSPGPVKRLDSV